MSDILNTLKKLYPGRTGKYFPLRYDLVIKKGTLDATIVEIEWLRERESMLEAALNNANDMEQMAQAECEDLQDQLDDMILEGRGREE